MLLEMRKILSWMYPLAPKNCFRELIIVPRVKRPSSAPVRKPATFIQSCFKSSFLAVITRVLCAVEFVIIPA